MVIFCAAHKNERLFSLVFSFLQQGWFFFLFKVFFIEFQNSVTKYFRTHYSKGEKLTWRNWRYLKVALVDQNVSFNIKKLVWILYLYLQDDATFTITVDGKTFHFQAQDSEERERWIRALEETVLRLVALLPPFFRCLKRKKGFLFVFPGNLEILIWKLMVLQLSSQCKVKKYVFEEDTFGNLKKVLKEKVILNWNFGKSKFLPF